MTDVNEEFISATIHMLCICAPSNPGVTDKDRALKAAMLAECSRSELLEIRRRLLDEKQRRVDAGTWSVA